MLTRMAFGIAFCWLLVFAGVAPATGQPQLVVTAPTGNVFATPDFRVSARCPDAPQCVLRVSVIYDNTPVSFLLAAGTGSIDTLVSPPDGVGTLRITANEQSDVTRSILVQSNPNYRLAASYQDHFLDLHPDRALLYDSQSSPFTLRIVDRAANTSQTIWTADANDGQVETGFLTPGGAIFIIKGAFSNSRYLREWRDGALHTFANPIHPNSLAVNGAWAIYSASVSGQAPLILRDLTTGADTEINPDAPNIDHAVSAAGRVYYSDLVGMWSSQIFEYAPGPPPTTTQLTNSLLASMRPITDGVNIVYTRWEMTASLATVFRAGDGTETVLDDTDLFGPISPEDARRIANGWVAFIRPDAGGAFQAWLRAPDGTLRQLTSTTGYARIKGLSGTGETILDISDSRGQPVARRYLTRPDGTMVNLGKPTGKPIQLDGEWFAVAGGQLLSVDDAEVPSRSILSEGATGTFFTTDVAILNPHDSAAPVTIRYLRENASALQETRTLPAMSRTTIHTDDIPGLEGTSVSTVVEAPASSPVVVERLMTWDATGYGGHLGTAVDRARPRWLFAEGAQGFFSTFFLLANSGADEASVTFTFLVERGSPVTYTAKVAPGTRKTVFAGDVTGLVNTSFATVIESDVPIVAERAMYFGASPFWLGGHGSAGVPEPAHTWFHAEGATGSLFDTFILLANPHSFDVPVKVTYRTDGGQVIERPRMLPASSRLTINIEDEAPELANVSVSTRVESTSYPIVSERAMYWGTTGSGWREAHNSFGVTASGLKWGLAEGRSGGDRGYQTYVLVANASTTTAQLRATFIKEDGTTVVRTLDVPRDSRRNIPTGDIPELEDSNFSTVVESTNGVPINVESAIYWNTNGVIWEGGGNTVGTRLQ